jgi:hypothetical protein
MLAPGDSLYVSTPHTIKIFHFTFRALVYSLIVNHLLLVFF